MTLRSLASIALVLVTSGALAAGCGSTRALEFASGNANLGLVGLLWEDIGALHEVGESPCPTEAGTVTLINHSTADDAVVDITGESSPIELRVTGETGTAPFVETTLAPMERVDVGVVFNCASTADVDQTITVTASVGGGAAETATIPVRVDVSGG